MMKSKTDIALAKMTEERDSWRRIASERQVEVAKLEEENAELRRTLERVSIWGNALANSASSVRDDINKNIERIQLERDKLRQKLIEISTLMQNALALAQDKSLKATETIKELVTSDTFKNNPLAEGIIALLYPIDEGRRKAVKSLRSSALSRNNIIEPDPIKDTDTYFKDIFMYIGAAAARETFEVVAKRITKTEDQDMIAFIIIKECEDRKAGDTFIGPSIETVSKLEMSWIEQNIPYPPKNYSTLREGLKTYRQLIASGLTQDEFFERTEINQKTQFRYKKWYEALEEKSRSNQIMLTLANTL